MNNKEIVDIVLDINKLKDFSSDNINQELIIEKINDIDIFSKFIKIASRTFKINNKLNTHEKIIEYMNEITIRSIAYCKIDKYLSAIFPKKITHEIVKDPEDSKNAEILAKGYFIVHNIINGTDVGSELNSYLKAPNDLSLMTLIGIETDCYEKAYTGLLKKNSLIKSDQGNYKISEIIENIIKKKINNAKTDPAEFRHAQMVVSACIKNGIDMPHPLRKFSTDVIDGRWKKPKVKQGNNQLRNFFFALATDRILRNFNFNRSKYYRRRKRKNLKPCCFEIVVNAARKCHMSPSYDAVQKAWVAYGPLFTIPEQIDALLKNEKQTL